MKLEFHGHDERYIVEQSMMNLFPLEKPVYGAVEPGETDWCRLTAEETAAGGRVSGELHYRAPPVRRKRRIPSPARRLSRRASGATPWRPASIWRFWI